MATSQVLLSRIDAELKTLEMRSEFLRDLRARLARYPDLSETIARVVSNGDASSTDKAAPLSGHQSYLQRVAAFFVSHQNQWATAAEVGEKIGIPAESARDTMSRQNREDFEKQVKAGTQQTKEFKLSAAAYRAAKEAAGT